MRPEGSGFDRHLRERAKPKDHPFLSQSLRISTVNGGFRNTRHPYLEKRIHVFTCTFFLEKKTNS